MPVLTIPTELKPYIEAIKAADLDKDIRDGFIWYILIRADQDTLAKVHPSQIVAELLPKGYSEFNMN